MAFQKPSKWETTFIYFRIYHKLQISDQLIKPSKIFHGDNHLNKSATCSVKIKSKNI